MSSEAILTRMELLRIARELVINEYIDRRAQDHNSWLANSDMAWRTRKVKLPYPTFPSYPSEMDIIARANVLNEFINGPVVAPTASPVVAAVIESVIEEPIVAPVVAAVIESVIEEPVVQEEIAPAMSIIEKSIEVADTQPIIIPVATVVIEPVSEVVESIPTAIVTADLIPEVDSTYANILKIFDATKMPEPIIPVNTAVVRDDVAAIMEIFKPATSGTMESIESGAASLSSVASAVVDAAAGRHDITVDSRESSFSSLLPNWLLKK